MSDIAQTSGDKVARWVVTGLIWLLVLAFVFPFYWMIVLGTHSNDEIYRFPPPLLPGDSLMDNWQQLTSVVPILRSMFNSVVIAVSHTVLVLVLCSLVGFAFARFRQAPGSRWMWRVVLATIFIPGVVGLIPWYILMARLGWIDTYWPLIIPGAVNGFAVFWMRQFIVQTVPVDLYDAARMDGASDWRTWASIVLPLIRPGLGALGIFTFMGTWTSFQIPLIVLNTREKFTYPLALADLNTLYHSDTAAVMLGSTISVLPIFIAFVLGAKQFMSGLTAGAVRG
jgi:ABC-type glycerol-3-phosphate transport system permease component